jgi:hypothetical protein
MTSASDKRCGFQLQPNVVVEVVNTPIRVLVVPGSNLRPETGITIEFFFVVFASSSSQVPG